MKSLGIFILFVLILINLAYTNKLKPLTFKHLSQRATAAGYLRTSGYKWFERRLIACQHWEGKASDWSTIDWITQKIELPSKMAKLEIRFNLPFTGGHGNSRIRLRMKLDKVVVSESLTHLTPKGWLLTNRIFKGTLFNVAKGPHTISLEYVYNALDGLNAPHLNKGQIEGKETVYAVVDIEGSPRPLSCE